LSPGAFRGQIDSEADIKAWGSWLEKQQIWFKDYEPEVLTIG